MKNVLAGIVLMISLFLMNTSDLNASVSLKVSSNNRFLTHVDDTPFFPTGDTCWEIPWDLTRSEVETYLQTRKNQHFNIVGINSFDWDQSRNSANRYGDQPFVMVGGKYDASQPITTAGNDPNNSTEYDYWDNLEYIIDLAASKGMYVTLLPCWGSTRVVGGSSDRMFDDLNVAYSYGHWIGDRFKNKTNIIWMMGGDCIPDKYTDYKPTFRKMAEGVADGVNGVTNNDGNADYSTTLMSYHPPKWAHSSSYYFPNDAFMDFNSTQDQPSDQINRITSDYALSPTKATWLYEGGYEERVKTDGTYTDWQCRFQAYQTVFAGGFGSMYGHMSIWEFKSDWATKINSAGANDMQHLLTLMTSVTDNQFLSRVPDQSLLDGDTGSMTGSEGMFSTCIVATRTTGSDNAMIYCANGRNIRVKMSQLAGSTMDARWFDPRSGAWSSAGTTIPSGAGAPIAEFDPPGSVANGNDYVLVLDGNVAPPTPMPGITNVYYSESTVGALPVQPQADDLTQQADSTNLIVSGAMHAATPAGFPWLFNSDADGSYGPAGLPNDGNAIFQDGISSGADTIFHCDFDGPKIIEEIHIFTHWGDQRVFSWFEVWASTAGTNDSDYSYIGTATLGEIGETNTPYVSKECAARLYDPNDGVILSNVVSLKFVQKNCGYGISAGVGVKETPGSAQGSYASITGCTSPEIDVIGFSPSVANEYFAAPTIAELPFLPQSDDLAQLPGTTKSIIAGGMHTAWGDNQFAYMFNSPALGEYGTGSVNSVDMSGVLLVDVASPNTTTMTMHIDFDSQETIKEIRMFSLAADARLFNYGQVSYSTTAGGPYTYIGDISFGDWGDLTANYANSNCVARLYDTDTDILASSVKSLEITMIGSCDNWTWDFSKKTPAGGGAVINEIDIIGIPEPTTLFASVILLSLAFFQRKKV